jgi:GNAT superfamily N-acetyltransferase
MAAYEISFDPARIDFHATCELLKSSYWGRGRSDAGYERAFANSLCAGAYLDGRQVAFARAITDRTYFGYLCDIIVWPEHRGQGLGQRLVRAFIDQPELGGIVHWSLSTSDAHGVYEKLGFVKSAEGQYMRLSRTPSSSF